MENVGNELTVSELTNFSRAHFRLIERAYKQAAEQIGLEDSQTAFELVRSIFLDRIPGAPIHFQLTPTIPAQFRHRIKRERSPSPSFSLSSSPSTQEPSSEDHSTNLSSITQVEANPNPLSQLAPSQPVQTSQQNNEVVPFVEDNKEMALVSNFFQPQVPPRPFKSFPCRSKGRPRRDEDLLGEPNVGAHQCEVCFRKFIRRRLLASHIVNVHSPVSVFLQNFKLNFVNICFVLISATFPLSGTRLSRLLGPKSGKYENAHSGRVETKCRAKRRASSVDVHGLP